jgi:uncharacterized protein (UPF0261 family)
VSDGTTPPVIAVLATLDSKEPEVRALCEMLEASGARPSVVDLSLRPHDVTGADITGDEVAEAAGSTWAAVGELGRGEAGDLMITGGRALLRRAVDAGDVDAILGLGGANGTAMACGIMRELPLLFPKVMVSAVASTAAVQWYVGASDIVMFPSIGDLALNRITSGVLDLASRAIVAMAVGSRSESTEAQRPRPLVGLSSFGGTAKCVDVVEERLTDAGFEVILFHASGPGGRALERLTRMGELTAVADVTTHELTDLLVGGVYSAGDGRLRAAGEAGVPIVVAPGALDHSNFWVNQVPEHHRSREFYQYNAQNILMRTTAEEYAALGELIADRLDHASGPVAILIPRRGFSEHTQRRTHDLAGDPIGEWHQPEADQHLVDSLRARLGRGVVEEYDLHINDPEFARIFAQKLIELTRRTGSGRARERTEA